jgi:hypothetical protein
MFFSLVYKPVVAKWTYSYIFFRGISEVESKNAPMLFFECYFYSKKIEKSQKVQWQNVSMPSGFAAPALN